MSEELRAQINAISGQNTPYAEAGVVRVYVGNFGDYVIPNSIYSDALALNGGKRLNDRRTRGAKLIEAWGLKMDAAAAKLHHA